MKNEIQNNKALLFLTILFSLILNGICARTRTNDEIKSLIEDLYSENRITYIFSNFINKLPTLNNQIFGVEYLFKLMRARKLENTDKIFEYARQYRNLGLVANIRLPKCVDTVVFSSSDMCFDTGKNVLKPYSNQHAKYTPYLLYEGNCQTERPKNNFYWRVTSDKGDNIKDLQTLDKSSQLKNVKFELAPDGERCYIKIGDNYLTQNGTTKFLTLVNDKNPNGIWYVRSRAESWYLSKK